jgi:choline dehydrogenase
MRILVVGAGTSGCAIAARLSEQAENDVTLLEPGPDYRPEELPSDLANGCHNALRQHDWGLWHRVNARQRTAFPLPRGRAVGGSSAVNTCIALRGQPEDYDEWANLGLTNWGWDKVLPSFRRLERDLDFGDRPAHSADGPLPVRRHQRDEWTPWQASFVDACLEKGVDACEDTNEPGKGGVGPHAMNKLNGRRISCAEAYLRDYVRARENLHIHPDTEVCRVLFKGRRACGIEAWTDQGVRTFEADRVILCAGAIHTPLLLLRSGIGNRDQVASLGVDSVAHSDFVAHRLLDHPGCAIFFVARPGSGSAADPLIQTVYRYSSGLSDVPFDIQIQPGSKVPLGDVSVSLFRSIMLAVGKPKGEGEIIWESVARGARPRINSRLLDHPVDRTMAVDAMEKIIDISQHSAMRALGRPVVPSPSKRRRREDIEWWIRKFTDSGYHASGTAPMGVDALSGCCDQSGRVFGVDGLLIGDASLMPTIPSSNTNIPTLMMAEHLAARWAKEL